MIWDIKSAFFDGWIVGSVGFGSISDGHTCDGGGSSESENDEKERNGRLGRKLLIRVERVRARPGTIAIWMLHLTLLR